MFDAQHELTDLTRRENLELFDTGIFPTLLSFSASFEPMLYLHALTVLPMSSTASTYEVGGS